MTTSHTPGPWEIDYDTRPAEVCCVHGLPPHGDDEQNFAYVRGAMGYWDADEAENLANIHLIAAAPDLLDALQVLVDNGGIGPEDMFRNARAALAKAKGEQP